MTPVCASPHHYCRKRAPVRLLAIALGLTLAFAVAAQDNNLGDCLANENGEGAQCVSSGQPLQEQSSPQPPSSQQSASEQSSPAPVADTSANENLSLFPWDWVPLEAVPEALRDRQCVQCAGRYMDPLAEQADITPADDNNIHADAISSQMQGDEVILIGEAKAVQGNRHMRSDRVVINRADESTALSSNITLREPNILLLGESAQIYSNTGAAIVYEGQFVFHREHMRGTADILQRDPDGLIHIHNGNFTYCAPGDDDWSVLSKDMEVDIEEGLATAHHARIEVEGTPVFYTPWLRLPLDDRRRTGLLWPDFGNDSSGGLDISTPVYLNLAPNYDALYAPRYIQDRGLDHELQLRYLNPLVGHWLVGGAYMDQDKQYSDEEQDQRNGSDDRWLGVVKQDGLFQERWQSRVDYSKASDVDYMKDLETANIDAQRKTSLLQLASMDYLGDSWLMNLRAQKFQSLADDINDDYEELPQFTSQYRSSGTPFELEPIALAQYSNFDAEEDVVTGQRLYGEAGLSYPMLWRFGSLQPTMKYRQVNYELSDARFFTDETPSAGAPLANIDGSLIFERPLSFGDKSLVQTLEPRLYYLYSEQEDQTGQPIFDTAELTFTYYQLFRETRFSGHDRLDDANQISAGVTSRFLDDATGRSLLSASVGQIYYFEDREVQLLNLEVDEDDPSSEIAGELGFTPTEKLGVRASMVWDPYADDMNSGFLEANYKTDNGSIFNAGYAYRRPQTVINTELLTEEASVSSYLPLDNNWSVFAAMNYSLEDDISVEDMVGVEYDTCCWTVRLLQLRYYNNVNGQQPDFDNPDLERQHTLQLQFLLKGMGGFGNRITNIMATMIRGYEEREY